MSENEPDPYIVGNTITLQLGDGDEDGDGDGDGRKADAKIIQTFTPFTLSCVMVVELKSPPAPLNPHSPMILKLFDRRFSTQHRKDWTSPPWTFDSEAQYQAFVANDGATEFFAKLHADKDLAEDGDDGWDSAQEEAFLYYHMREFYEREVETYGILDELQGKYVPRLWAKVTLEVETPRADDSIVVSEAKRGYIDIPGILLQYIDGFSLPDLAAHAPREMWQGVCDEAIRIVNVIMDKGVLNQDVNVRSFVVCMGHDRGFKVFMLDFAMCWFRREYVDEADWRRWLAIQDQEGAVGVIMEKRLKGGFVYRRSAKASQLQAEFKREG